MRQVLGHKPSKEWDYRADFPRLKRCMAILFETLRVKTLVPEVKWTSDRPQSLDIKGRTLVIPPKTLVIPSYIHVHNSPQIWGADADMLVLERLENCRSGSSFVNSGPRICIGQLHALTVAGYVLVRILQGFE